MKQFLFTFLLILINAAWFGVCAQVTPSGAGDKSLENRDVKGRSVELERVRRDTDKETSKAALQKPSEAKFAEIKEDFEKMQTANEEIQKSVIAAEINYKSVNDSSAQINKSAARLKSNLFPNAKSKKSKDKNKSVETAAPPVDLKTLTDTMNGAIFDFTHNPMFSNPKFTETDSAKAQSDLEKIMTISVTLKNQTEKTN